MWQGLNHQIYRCLIDHLFYFFFFKKRHGESLEIDFTLIRLELQLWRFPCFLWKDINQDRHPFIISSYNIKICECAHFKIYIFIHIYIYFLGSPGGSVVKNLPVNTGDASLAPELGRSPGEGNGNPLQYSCL